MDADDSKPLQFELGPLGPTPPGAEEVERAIALLTEGAYAEDVESETLDCKEDPSLRGPAGEPASGDPRSEAAARLLAEAAACLANHEGGTLIVGIDDHAQGLAAFRGTTLDRVWLVARLRELTQPPLTVTIGERQAGAARLLLVHVPRNPSVEPHSAIVSKSGGRRTPRRVGTQCQDMASLAELMSWAQGRSGEDWSAGPSGRPVGDIRPGAMDALRRVLIDAQDLSREEIAGLDDTALLARLQLLRPDGSLTRAGALLLCAAAVPRIVYRARPASGARAEHRFERPGLGLLEELLAVESEIDGRNRRFELASRSPVVRETRAIAARAVREALVNAIAHRDWGIPEPVIVEQFGDELIVYSPGGLFEVELDKLLTAPSRTRNRSLADVLRSLRLAEREGTGIDRMYIEQVRLGHRPPVFEERDGGIRVALVGGPPVAEIALAYGDLPENLQASARAAVALDLLRERPSITLAELATAAQEQPDALTAFLVQAEEAGLLRPVAHPRPSGERAWRLADPVRAALGPVLAYYARPVAESLGLVARLARQMGVIRNQDVQDLLGLSTNRVSALLRQAQENGILALAPGASARGRGAAYVLADAAREASEH